jgi:hypothetical protein
MNGDDTYHLDLTNTDINLENNNHTKLEHT